MGIIISCLPIMPKFFQRVVSNTRRLLTPSPESESPSLIELACPDTQLKAKLFEKRKDLYDVSVTSNAESDGPRAKDDPHMDRQDDCITWLELKDVTIGDESSSQEPSSEVVEAVRERS